MLAVKSMDVRENFKALCDKVFHGETLVVSRPKNENIVMMSENKYNEIISYENPLITKIGYYFLKNNTKLKKLHFLTLFLLL